MTYKSGDKVIVKPLSWFKENCTFSNGKYFIDPELSGVRESTINFFQGKILTVDEVNLKLFFHHEDGDVFIKERYNDYQVFIFSNWVVMHSVKYEKLKEAL